jgi:hypothetical protein
MQAETLRIANRALCAAPDAPRIRAKLRRLLGNSSHFSLHDTGSASREALEQYIHGSFSDAYGADVTEFAPLLLELQCASSTSGVVGLRPAVDGPLFSEAYLDSPVEQFASELSGQSIERHDIIEVGNLAAIRPGACQLINIMLAALTSAAGFRYACLASTSKLERILHKQHFTLSSIAMADPVRLGKDAARWGSYYATEPRVLLVDLQATMATLNEQFLSAEIFRLYASNIKAFAPKLNSSTTVAEH